MLQAVPAVSEADHLVLWDVVDEHLDEAGFLWTQWEHALQSSRYTLAAVATTVEERLLAHLDALVVGGDVVARQRLWPALQSGEPETIFAAAFALLDGLRDAPQIRLIESTFARLVAATIRHEPSLGRAFELAAPLASVPLLQNLLQAADAHHRVLALHGLAGLGALPVGALPQLLVDADPTVRSVALELVGQTLDPPAQLAALVRHRLQESPQAAALQAAAILGLPELADYCLAVPVLPADATAIALQLCAFSDDPQLHAHLRRSLDEPSLAGAALYALGFTGARADADQCVERLHGPLSPLATEAFVGITGVDLEAHGLLAPNPIAAGDGEWADRDGEFVSRPDSQLPVADADALAAWWQKNRARFAPAVRYLHGLAAAGESTWLLLLRTAVMRRRQTLGLALATRSHGRHVLATQTLARRQQKALDVLFASRALSAEFRELGV